MSFFDDMEKALLEAIEIEKGNVPLKDRNIETKSCLLYTSPSPRDS